MVTAVVDRFEGDLAVLLFGDEEFKVNLPRKFLPPGTREGDVLRVDLRVDEAETDLRRVRVQVLIAELKDRTDCRRKG